MRLPLSLAIVLAASGCSWIGTDDYTSRLDLDGDGVSGVVDCDDTDASIWEPGRFFVDDDGDGFGDPGSPVDACQKAAPTGAVLDDSDCDDSDDRVHPDAAEVCNGIDDDCDEQVDDDDNSLDRDSAETWLPDADGDGYTTDAFQLSVQACEQPSGFAAPSGQADCDDADSAVNPAAPEACGDGIDNDCDGVTDDAGVGGASYYADADEDGWPDDWTLLEACEDPSGGQVRLADAPTGTDEPDCDPDDPLVNPGVEEAWYDGVDADCDGADDFDRDADGFRDPSGGGADCDDADDSVYPGAADSWYDGIDADCAGNDDFDQDGDGEAMGADCDDTDASVLPGALDAWYDGVDSDCAGNDDFDQDGDGDRHASGGGGDCDDTDDTVYTGAADAWYDGVDSDCAGDDDFDQDGDGATSSLGGGYDCDDTDATRYPDAVDDWYDGVDSDCAGDDDFDRDGDGDRHPIGGGADCDDADASVFTGAPDAWYDGVDSDCVGDDDFDRDGDGERDPSGGGMDCDDADPSVRPGAVDAWYDGEDTDCAGNDDFDQDGDGHRHVLGGGSDCADDDPTIRPDADEIWYDGVDQDCQGDDDYDQDGDGRTPVDAPSGTRDDCVDTDPTTFAGALEVPGDGIDQDCNTYDAVSCYADADSDGFGDIEVLGLLGVCDPGFSLVDGDCDDSDPDAWPGAPELCDLIDQDCTGTAEGGVASATAHDGSRWALSDGDTVSGLDLERIDVCGGTWDLQVAWDLADDDLTIESHSAFPRSTLTGRSILTGVGGALANVTIRGFDLGYDDSSATFAIADGADPFARSKLTLEDLDVTSNELSRLVWTLWVDVAAYDVTVRDTAFAASGFEVLGGGTVLDGVRFEDNATGTDLPWPQQTALLRATNGRVDLSDTWFLRTMGRGAYLTDADVVATSMRWEDNVFDDAEVASDGGALYLEDSQYDDEGSVYLRNATRDRGGAICAVDSDMTIADAVFDDNGPAPAGMGYTVDEGGTLWVDGDLYLEGTSITNSAATRSSGGIHHTGGVFWFETSTLIDSTLEPGNDGPVALHTSGTWAVLRDTSTITGFHGEESTCVEIHNSGNAFLHGMTFTDCQALCLSLEDGSTIRLSGNTFRECLGDGGDGGAVRAQGMSAMNIGVNTFELNYADGDGGALWVDANYVEINNNDPKLLSFSGSGYGYSTYETSSDRATFSGNYAGGDGGAVYLVGGVDHLCDATFTSNAAGSDGGALFVEGNLPIFDDDGCEHATVVDGNVANDDGGGLYVLGTLDLTELELLNNEGTLGGGAFVSGTLDGGANAVVSGNNATFAGGGIYNEVFFGYPEITDTEFSENGAFFGGGLYFSGSGFNQDFPPVLFSGTTFRQNQASEGSAFYMEPMYGVFEIPDLFSFTLSDSFSGDVTLDRNQGPSAIVRAGPDGDWLLDIETLSAQSLDDQGTTCALPIGTSQVTCAPGEACICP